MAFFSDLAQHIDTLRDALGMEVAADSLPLALSALDDEGVVAVIAAASQIIRAAETARIAASGVAATRSTREAGHGGLAQKRGHRSPVAMVQELTGSTRADAIKQVRLGESLLEGAGLIVPSSGSTDAAAPADPESIAEPWHAPLGRALLDGVISSSQHDVILRGLGEPPLAEDPETSRHIADVWSLAAAQLIGEAAERTVEELARTARTVRDQLDPEGAERRFDERFERRSFRTWTDTDGVRRGSIVFDDLGGTWAQSILDAALRPRRGGPRFVDPAEKARADELAGDPRTNDQLAYDLFLDVLRAGAQAESETVFGARQAGVRVVITKASLDAVASGGPAVGLVEEDQAALPAWLIGQQACDTGTRDATVDARGNPLDLGREARLYSTRQRVTLAIRDGGCRWKGCDRPASYCEAHHIDPYAQGGGTDIDRGILLCRFHHMELHHGGWRITRTGRGDFLLHPPGGGGDPIVLAPRLALRYAWVDIAPPPNRFRPAA